MAVPAVYQLPLFAHEKRCAKCGELKSLDAFYQKVGTSDGRTARCKPCLYTPRPRPLPPPKGYRVCAKCRETLPLDAFHRAMKRTEGRAYWCRFCASRHQKSHRDKQRQRAGRLERDARLSATKKTLRNRRRYLHYQEANRAYTRRYHQEHAEQARLAAKLRRDRRRCAVGYYTAEDVERLSVRQGGLCYYCHGPYGRYDIEHKQPLSRGGTNWPENICLACDHCNSRKHNKTEAEFRALLAAEPSSAPGGRRARVRSCATPNRH